MVSRAKLSILRNVRNINKTLAVLLATLFLVTIFSTIYLTKTLQDSRRLIKDGSDTVGVVFLLQDLQQNLQAAESSQRGFIITGDPEFLKNYTIATKTIPAEQQKLTAVIGPAEKANLDDLIKRRLDLLAKGIQLRQTQGFEAASTAIKGGVGNNLSAEIHNLINQIAQQKFVPLTPIYNRTERGLKRAVFVAGATVSLVFIITTLIALYFRSAIRKERATEGVKKEFLSLASHQLRTPASNVKQYLALLLEGYLGKLKPEQRDAVEVANKNNEIGINIINDLLDVAKLDLDKIHLHKERTEVYPLIEQVVNECRPQLKEKMQTIKFDRTTNKKVKVLADTTYLKTVFENLIDNASKYSGKKTRINIKIYLRQNRVIVSIKDEGVGIKKREMGKLFKKFSRVSNESVNNTEGSGLGLYWVKHIVELHGGRVTVKSKPDKGSTFEVELPAE